MDRGVQFVLDNFEKTLSLINERPQFEILKRKVIAEYHRVKYIKFTGNMYEYFLKFRGGTRKFADDFAFLENYGIISNELMADYLKNNYSDELDHYCGINDLIIGNVYSNNEISNTFKCSYMGGMRRSLQTNSLVLIAKHNNPLYDDQWTDEGILNYTGMGTTGNQSISYAQNKILATAKQEGIKVYLFESYKDNEYYYDGEVEIFGSIFQAEELDAEGNLREVIKFPLRKIKSDSNIVINLESIKQSEKEKIKEVQKHSIEDVKKKAKESENKIVMSKEVKTTYRERNQFIAEYTKNRTKGICDLCGEEAPFKDKNGNPYLESHHIITLANGGPDAIYNTVAICPNCHRRMHVLSKKEDIEKLQKVLFRYLLTDEDKENLRKFEALFKS